MHQYSIAKEKCPGTHPSALLKRTNGLKLIMASSTEPMQRTVLERAPSKEMNTYIKQRF